MKPSKSVTAASGDNQVSELERLRLERARLDVLKDRQLLSTNEAALLLGIPAGALRDLPVLCVRIGRHVRYRRRELDAYIARLPVVKRGSNGGYACFDE